MGLVKMDDPLEIVDVIVLSVALGIGVTLGGKSLASAISNTRWKWKRSEHAALALALLCTIYLTARAAVISGVI